MCGILGTYNLYDKVAFDKALNLMTNRGPDGFGVWSFNNNKVTLGHRRLSILDLTSAGNQPFIKHNFVIVFNGELFNFLEIKEELKKKGISFISDTDTEVILEAYRTWGTEAFSKFNGMWAFCIYNKNTDEIILSRDRYGVKPLYYYYQNKQLIFGSEVKAFYPFLKEKCTYQLDTLLSILTGSFESYGTEFSYLKNVLQVPSGCYAKLINNHLQIERWYYMRKVDISSNYAECVEHLRELLISSCQLRLRSDVPVATCLSGGIDSSAIAGVLNMARDNVSDRFRLNSSYEAFCAMFPNSVIDESNKALKMANYSSLNLNIIPITVPDGISLEAAMSKFDGPSSTLAFYPILKLYEAIKAKGITVSIDGQGPDEMLGGYSPLKAGLQAAIELKSPSWFLDLYKTYSAQGERNDYSSKGNAKIILHDVLWKDKMRKILGRETKSSQKLHDNNFNINHLNNSFDKSLANQFFQRPLPGILHQYDRCSMAASVECRMPFMDYRIVEFIFSLPPNYKVRNGYTKKILRDAIKDVVPDEIRNDKVKLGFNAPMVEWFRDGINDWVLDQMNSLSFINSEYFDGRKIREEYMIFLKSNNPQWHHSWKFWPPIHFTWWNEYSKQLI